MKTFIYRRRLVLLLALCMIFCIALGCTACGGVSAATMFLRKAEGVVDIFDGEDKEVALAENLGLYSGYTVGTESASYAWIDLDKVKLAKLDENSEAEITKDGKNLTIDVTSGSLFFNVTEPLTEDETMEIRTSTMAVGIRGTCGWVELTRSNSLLVSILEGTVVCSVTGADGQVQTAEVSGGQTAVLSLDASGQPCIDMQPFTENDVRSFVLEEVTDDRLLCDKIEQASGLQLLGFEGSAQNQSAQALPADGSDATDSSATDTQDQQSPLAQYCLGDYADYQLSSEIRGWFASDLERCFWEYDAVYAVLFNAGNGVTGMLAAAGNTPTVNEQGYVQMEEGRVWLSFASETDSAYRRERYVGDAWQLFDGYALRNYIFVQGYSQERYLLTDGSMMSYEYNSEELPYIENPDDDGWPRNAEWAVTKWIEHCLQYNGEMPQAFAAFYSDYWLIDPETGTVYPAESQEDWDTCIILDGLFPVGNNNEGMIATLRMRF